ncbi:MAG: biopolymer transporter ExbB [Paracoccaceae bacterium]
MIAAQDAAPQFTQPVRQIVWVVVALALVAGGSALAWPAVAPVFLANPWLNGFIGLVFLVGLGAVFGQIAQVVRSVGWIEGFAIQRSGSDIARAPQLLAPLATLLRSRGARMQLSPTSARSILDSVAQRIDEDREISRWIVNALIFLGLLGTFFGLATTVPGLVETIRSLSAEDGSDVFTQLQDGLEGQLGGMGVAFASSLIGLAGSLVLSLIELLAGHGQNRFYRELEEWLSSITRVGLSGEEGGESGMMATVIDGMAEQMDALQAMFTATDEQRSAVDDRLSALSDAMAAVARKLDGGEDTRALLARVAEGQEVLIQKIADTGMEGIDAESRMRLRSIDVQMLRILEELSAGRAELAADLRTDIAQLSRSLRAAAGR